MKTDEETVNRIAEIVKVDGYLLNVRGETLQEDGPTLLQQVEIVSRLDELYWMLGKERPRYKCDE